MNNSILIVEDEGLVALEIKESIESLGYTVSGIAHSGDEAIEMARTTHPDLVLMDVRLKGGMDGIETAARIRKSLDLPFVFLTAYSGNEILQRAMTTEPYAYLLKPVQQEQLASALRMAWHKHSKDVARKASMEQYSAILAAIPNGVLVLDTSMRVRYLNARARQLTGTNTKTYYGRPVEEVVRLERHGLPILLPERISELDPGKGLQSLDNCTLTTLDGVSQQVEVGLSPFSNQKGEIIGTLLVFAGRIGAEDTGFPGNINQQIEYGVEHGPENGQVPDNETEKDSLTGGDRLTETILAQRGLSLSEPGQLRSYLEMEIIGLALADPPKDIYERGHQEGQMTAIRKVLAIVFGDRAVRDIEEILNPYDLR